MAETEVQDANHRDVMDACVEEVRKSGRASLVPTEDDYDDDLHFEETDSPRLQEIISKLSYAQNRVAQDNDKYIVPRDGITSFVYLADDKNTSPSRARVD